MLAPEFYMKVAKSLPARRSMLEIGWQCWPFFSAGCKQQRLGREAL
jgi:hypothetical protein